MARDYDDDLIGDGEDMRGHNSRRGDDGDGGDTSIAAEALQMGIERIERLEEKKKGISDDIRDVYSEMKSQGFDTKAIREIVKLRKKDKNVRDEEEAILETYMIALGML